MSRAATSTRNAREWAARAMSERQWQELVVAHAELRGWRVFHQFDSRRSAKGWPDLTLIRGPEILFAELKKQDGRVSHEQAGVLELLEVTGQEVHVWRPSDEPAVIDRLSRTTSPT